VTRVSIEVPGPARLELESLIRSDGRFEVVGEHRDADVILADVGNLRSLRIRFGNDPAVVVLTDRVTRREIQTALRSGANAVLHRHSSFREIAAALEAAAAGLTALGPAEIDALLPPAPPDSHEDFAEPLTPREIEVLMLLADGKGNKEIANRLKVSEHTVKFHVSSILGKLGAASRTEAVTEAIRRGLVTV